MNTTYRPTESPAPELSPNLTPFSQLSDSEISAIVDAEYRHVDYDRHPLRVQGLDHYTDSTGISERFHVW